MNRKTTSIPARKRAAVALLVPFLDPLRWAKRAVGLGEELARLVVLSLLGGALVELVVARVAVTGLVGRREARIVRRRSDLHFNLLLLVFLLLLLRTFGLSGGLGRLDLLDGLHLALALGRRQRHRRPHGRSSSS